MTISWQDNHKKSLEKLIQYIYSELSKNIYNTSYIIDPVGERYDKRVFLPRIPMMTSENLKMPFILKRKQFPVRLVFALTINKSQEQIIPHVSLYLLEH
ncbi:6847_t:CDS:2, partial [Scutellospora calospora]